LATAAGPRLFGWTLAAAAVDGVIGGAHDAFEIFGAAMGALHFHGIFAAHSQEFKKFITFQTFKFINRHLFFLINVARANPVFKATTTRLGL
jgi:hypothetical protein